MLNKRKSCIQYLAGDSDINLCQVYGECYNYKVYCVDCTHQKSIESVILDLYDCIFPHELTKTKTAKKDIFFTFLKSSVDKDIIFYLKNITFIKEKSNFYRRVSNFLELNQSFSIIFFIHLAISNKAFIPNIIWLSNVYSLADKHHLFKIFFNKSCGTTIFILHLCLNYCTIGHLLGFVKLYVINNQYDSITLESVKEIYSKIDNVDELKVKFIKLHSKEKQILKIILDNYNLPNTYFLLNAQICRLYKGKSNIMPILRSLCKKKLIVCNKSDNCSHAIKLNFTHHCNCIDVSDVHNCSVCIFSIAESLSYKLHMLLSDFSIDKVYN